MSDPIVKFMIAFVLLAVVLPALLGILVDPPGVARAVREEKRREKERRR